MNETVTVSELDSQVDYEADFFLWTQQQAALLRARNDTGPDWEHLAEEIESLGGSQRRALRSRLIVLMAHLLKWEVQVAYRSGSWARTINVQRRDIERLLKESPSLRRTVAEVCHASFEDAVDLAVRETGLAPSRFPRELPFPVDKVMDDWLPGDGRASTSSWTNAGDGDA